MMRVAAADLVAASPDRLAKEQMKMADPDRAVPGLDDGTVPAQAHDLLTEVPTDVDIPARALFRQPRRQHPDKMTSSATFKKPQRLNPLNF
jgi:hypothetical protein